MTWFVTWIRYSEYFDMKRLPTNFLEWYRIWNIKQVKYNFCNIIVLQSVCTAKRESVFQCISSSFLCVPHYIVVDIQRQLTIFLSAAWHALIELCDWNWNKTRPRQQLWVWFPDERPEEDAKLPPSLPLPVDVNENLGAELSQDLR